MANNQAKEHQGEDLCSNKAHLNHLDLIVSSQEDIVWNFVWIQSLQYYVDDWGVSRLIFLLKLGSNLHLTHLTRWVIKLKGRIMFIMDQ